MADLERGTAATTTGPGVVNEKGTRHGFTGNHNGHHGVGTGVAAGAAGGALAEHHHLNNHGGYGAGGYGGGANYSRIANPHPLGILSFGLTLFVFSLYSVHARGIYHPNVIVGLGLFLGGLAQLLAGQWAFPRGSTFAATVYTMYGAFWIAYAIILIPGTGVGAAFPTANEFGDALGIFYILWMVITFIFLIASIKRHISFLAFFFFLMLFFMFEGAAYMKSNNNLFKAGGAFGIVAALIAHYIGLAKLIENDRNFNMGRLPLGYLGTRDGPGTGAAGAGRTY
jgi:succinate-acetate transporter protein